MKKLLTLVLCLCLIISIFPTTFVSEAEASGAITYTYAYDAQRNPAFPASKDDKVTVSVLQKPLRAGASAMSGVFRYENNKGEWKLTEVGPYSGISSASPKPSSFLRPIVKSIADKYGISDMNTVVIHQLTDKMGNHVAYGVIISSNESRGYAIFLADLFNESGAGVFLAKNEVTESSVSFTSDKSIQTKTSSTPTYNTTGYNRAELSLSEIPVAGKKPVNLKYTRSDAEITMQEWSGKFDENGCFKPGEAYTLTAELTIKPNSNSSFITTPGGLQVEFFYKASSDFFAEIISLTPYVVKAKYTFYTDDETDFAIDEYGTALANTNLDVFKDASAGAKTIGEIKINEKVKVLRAYVNGDIVYSKHMIEYNGGVAYVRGCYTFGKDKYFRSVKVEGKIDPNNVPSNRVPDFGNTEKEVVSSVAISSFKADYGTKPVLTVFESDYYKAESIVYSTDMVKEKFSPVTATVTYIPTSPNYIERIFSEKTTASKGEIISVSEKKLVVKYTTYSGTGDTLENIPDGIVAFGRDINGGSIYVNKYAYAKAKVKSMSGSAKLYNQPAMIGKTTDPGEVLYIRDETVNSRFPELADKWVIVSKERTGTCFFIPKAFLGDYEYLGSYMEGAPADDKNTPFNFAGGKGTPEDPYQIQTADQLNAVRYGPMLHYKLIADIDLSSWGNWVPIGGTPGYGHMGGDWNKVHDGACAFLGSFDGNGHVVSGMTIKITEDTPYMTEAGNTRAYGLFANLATNPEYEIKNLGVVNFKIDVNYTNIKKPLTIYAAAIAGGMNNGMGIYNCYSKGGKIQINVTGDYVANPALDVYAGGICSFGSGSVKKSFNASDISVNYKNVEETNVIAAGIFPSISYTHIYECYNTGNISVPVGSEEGFWLSSLAAGISGYSTIHEIPGIYHFAPEGTSYILNCYNTGSITGRSANGVFGFSASDIHLENCYSIGKLTGNTYDAKNGISSTNTVISPSSAVVDYGSEFIRNCSGNGNSVSGNAWKASSSLGRKVLSAIPEDKQPSTNYKFVSTSVGGFSDVKSDAWYAGAVTWAVTKKITSGTSATTFSPDTTCTKAQILTFLWRASGSRKPGIANPFTDVKESDYFYDAAVWAYEWGIISEKTFKGNTPCTRRATVEYMWKSKGAPAATYAGNFTDVSKSSSYASAVAWAVTNGITSGTSDTTFSPDATCTRGQIVTFLNRAFK